MAFALSAAEGQANMLDIHAQNPEHARLFAPLVSDVMRTGECAFTSAEWELIAGFVSKDTPDGNALIGRVLHEDGCVLPPEVAREAGGRELSIVVEDPGS